MGFVHLTTVLDALEDLAGRFNTAGHRLFLVGGIVRDQMLDRPLGDSADIDLTTEARPDVIKRLVAPVADAMWTQGERFGTIGLKHAGHSIEITTHRAESYDPESRKPTVAFGDRIQVDLSRRDFTINAMAIELPAGDLVDPWGGAVDLNSRILRTPLAPQVSFSDDPLRVMRAARFIARFDLEPTPELTAAATELAPRLEIVAIERITVELVNLLETADPRAGLGFLGDTGIIAELARRAGADPKPTDEQLCRAADVAGRTGGGWRDKLAAMLIALVEPHRPDRPRTEPEVQATVDSVTRLARGFRLSAADLGRVVNTTGGGLRLAGLGLEPAELRAWILDTRDRDGAWATALHHTDDPDRYQAVWDAASRLARAEDLDNVEILGGAEVMAELGIPGGPAVGEAIEHLRRLIIANGPIDAATQRRQLHHWHTT